MDEVRQDLVPLIKSEAEGVAQVVDTLGNPLLALSDSRRGYLSHLVSVHLTSTRFVASANTVITPASIGTPSGWACCGVMADTCGINKRRIVDTQAWSGLSTSSPDRPFL